MKKLDIESVSLEGCIDLIGAVIGQALEDLKDPREKIRKSAEAFFLSKKYKDWCTTFNVNPDYVLETANRHNGGVWIMQKILQKIKD